MTGSQTKPPLSPADYMRLVARPQHKLYAYTALIRELMEAGFNDYRIWRYLVDEYKVNIGRTTAHRFCTALRAGRIPTENGTPTGLGTGAAKLPNPAQQTSVRSSFAPPKEAQSVEGGSRMNDEGVAPAHEPGQQARGDTPGPSVEAEPPNLEAARDRAEDRLEPGAPAGPTATVPTPPNDAPATAAFEPTSNWTAPRIEIAEGTPDWVPGDVLKRFKISAPSGTRMLEAYRRRTAEEDDADTSQQGPQSDQHDDIREQ